MTDKIYITEKEWDIASRYFKTAPKQFGNLHERMQYVIALVQKAGHKQIGSDLWHAIFDLETEIRHIEPPIPPFGQRCVGEYCDWNHPRRRHSGQRIGKTVKPKDKGVDGSGLYSCYDLLSKEELKALGVPSYAIMAKPTGEIRPPRKGEWYLSGANVQAYKALSDATTTYPIAKLVLTRGRKLRR